FTNGPHGYVTPASHVNGAIKCQQISGGEGFATMGDGTQTYLFAFGPLSGLADIALGMAGASQGKSGTQFPSVFNTVYPASFTAMQPGFPDCDPASDNPYAPACAGTFTQYNGAVGLTGDSEVLVPAGGSGAVAVATLTGGLVTDVTVTNGGSGYNAPPTL